MRSGAWRVQVSNSCLLVVMSLGGYLPARQGGVTAPPSRRPPPFAALTALIRRRRARFADAPVAIHTAPARTPDCPDNLATQSDSLNAQRRAQSVVSRLPPVRADIYALP